MLVRVTRGCAWNRCTFCGMYRQLKLELRTPEEIEKDLASLRQIYPRADSVFLADSDSLIHPKLPEIVRLVTRAFPEAARITSYVRLNTLRKKKAPWLAELREAGLSRLHAGLESGSARILERTRKGIDPEKAISGSRAAIEAGFELSLYVLCGLGGEDDWEEHADGTAEVVRAVWPHFVRLRTLILLPESDLATEHRRGRFEPASALTRLREVRLFLQGLKGKTRPLHIASDHFSNLVWADKRRIYDGIEGVLPGDGPAMLAELDLAIELGRAAKEVVDPGALARSGRAFGLYSPQAL